MEQNRDPRHKPTRNFFDTSSKYKNREKIVFQVRAGKLDSHMQKNKDWIPIHTIYKNQLKWIKDLKP